MMPRRLMVGTLSHFLMAMSVWCERVALFPIEPRKLTIQAKVRRRSRQSTGGSRRVLHTACRTATPVEAPSAICHSLRLCKLTIHAKARRRSRQSTGGSRRVLRKVVRTILLRKVQSVFAASFHLESIQSTTTNHSLCTVACTQQLSHSDLRASGPQPHAYVPTEAPSTSGPPAPHSYQQSPSSIGPLAQRCINPSYTDQTVPPITNAAPRTARPARHSECALTYAYSQPQLLPPWLDPPNHVCDSAIPL
jgi:hypothetical protein